jgi:hypothetical protein
MALSTPPTRTARPRAVSVGRGRPETVTIRRSTLMAGLLEGMALADEARIAAERIHTAAALGNRSLVLNEAGRLGHRAQRARDEFRRMALDVEE